MQGALIAVVAICAVLALNVRASMVIARDALSERSQKVWQLALVWLLPIFGAILTLAIHRPSEKPSRRYRRAPDPGDDFAQGGRSQKVLSDALDGD
jgi:hypothetical protein